MSKHLSNKGAQRLQEIFGPEQQVVAKRLNIHHSYLSLLTHGKRLPSMKVAARLQRVLGIPVESWVEPA